MRLSSQDATLLSAAMRRYDGFNSTEQKRFSIEIETLASSKTGEGSFACEFEGAHVVADADSARFTGVRHEYALDSLLRMLLSWRLLPETGFLLHAATVVRNGKAYVFFGRSGAGKSTVASLSPSGSVFTDEISLLKRLDGEWRAFGTPFWGDFRADGMNCSAPLAGVFRLLQAPENRVESLRPAELVKALLPCVLFFSSRVGDHQRLLEILAATSREVPGYNLQFQKNRSFWEAISS